MEDLAMTLSVIAAVVVGIKMIEGIGISVGWGQAPLRDVITRIIGGAVILLVFTAITGAAALFLINI